MEVKEFEGKNLSELIATSLESLNLKEEEIDLIRVISKLPEVVEESGNIRRVHNLAQYMQDLASAFNKFYRAVPVIGSEYEKERLQLVYSSKIALKNSLNLLGISAPDVM